MENESKSIANQWQSNNKVNVEHNQSEHNAKTIAKQKQTASKANQKQSKANAMEKHCKMQNFQLSHMNTKIIRKLFKTSQPCSKQHKIRPTQTKPTDATAQPPV